MQRLRPSFRRIKHPSARYSLRIGRSRIHRSRIHGFGVFALEDILPARQVVEYTGRRLSRNQAALLKPPHDDYLVGPHRGTLINGSVGGSGAEFINHNCNPNLTWRRQQDRLFFYSRRAIRSGEELTMYFSYPTNAHHVRCVCGARKCRKTLGYFIE